MRILLVIRSLGVGGAERQCLKLAGGLSARGHEVWLCTLGSTGALGEELARMNVVHRDLGHSGPAYSFRTSMRLRSLMKQLHPDVVYSFMPVSNVFCALSAPASLRRRCVWGIRAAGFAAGPKGLRLVGRIALYLERLLSRVPSRIVTNSQAAVDAHVRVGFDRDRFRVSENVIDTDTFRFDESIRSRSRSLMGVDSSTKVVVIVSRLDPIKGYETFIDAALGVLEKRRDVSFWGVGGGDQRIHSALASLIKRRAMDAHFRWFGEIRDTAEVARLLMASDLAVSASWSEGFPNSIAEYAACGLRVVATDVGDSRRIVGENGACVPSGDANAMCARILAELDRAPARDFVRADFIGRFHPETLMDRHEAILKEVATIS